MARDGHGIWEGVQLLGGEERSNYPLTLSVDDLGAGFGLSVLAVPQIGAQRLCDYMLSAVQQLIASLETAPHSALCQLPILPAAERDTVLREFNATAHDFPVARPCTVRLKCRPSANPIALPCSKAARR